MYQKVTNFIIIGMLGLVVYLVMQQDIQSFFSWKAQKKSELHTKKLKSILGYSVVSIDPERVQLLGISTEKIKVRDLTKKIRTIGVINVDERRIAHVQTKFSGWIEELYVDFIGMPVKNNQPLFSVYSPELLATQEEYLIALNAVDRKITGRFATELEQSNKELLLSTRRRLELWDISSEQIRRLGQDRTPTKTLLFRSPIDGIVLDKKVFVGMNVAPGMNTYTIADLSYVWALADMYENDESFIKLGQKAMLTTLSLPGKVFYGSITFIDYVVAASTRTVKVRFEFDNPRFDLKPGMFGTVNIELPMGKVLALPEEALIDTGTRKVVFIAKEKGRYEPREVKLGFKAGLYYQVFDGVSENESVVISAQFLLDSESRLKAFEGHMKGHGVE